jgi:hypothetical protein
MKFLQILFLFVFAGFCVTTAVAQDKAMLPKGVKKNEIILAQFCK